MVSYASQHEVVIDLHERGFSQDFEFAEGGIRWVQQNAVLQIPDCSVVEFYSMPSGSGTETDVVILGIVSFSQLIKGILIQHLSLAPSSWPKKVQQIDPQMLLRPAQVSTSAKNTAPPFRQAISFK